MEAKAIAKYYNLECIEVLTGFKNIGRIMRQEEEKNGMCHLYLKPKKYQNYTLFLDWHKGDSLNHLINLQKIEINYILQKIKNMTDNDWN
jgi:phosphomannomutase